MPQQHKIFLNAKTNKQDFLISDLQISCWTNETHYLKVVCNSHNIRPVWQRSRFTWRESQLLPETSELSKTVNWRQSDHKTEIKETSLPPRIVEWLPSYNFLGGQNFAFWNCFLTKLPSFSVQPHANDHPSVVIIYDLRLLKHKQKFIPFEWESISFVLRLETVIFTYI